MSDVIDLGWGWNVRRVADAERREVVVELKCKRLGFTYKQGESRTSGSCGLSETLV